MHITLALWTWSTAQGRTPLESFSSSFISILIIHTPNFVTATQKDSEVFCQNPSLLQVLVEKGDHTLSKNVPWQLQMRFSLERGFRVTRLPKICRFEHWHSPLRHNTEPQPWGMSGNKECVWNVLCSGYLTWPSGLEWSCQRYSIFDDSYDVQFRAVRAGLGTYKGSNTVQRIQTNHEKHQQQENKM